MKRIGLISDTHSWLDPQVFRYFENCDELWHAGDFGSMDLIEQLQQFKPLRGVYGNIDDGGIRRLFPEKLSFNCEGLQVCMQHIGGYPGRYAPGVKDWLRKEHAGLFISGHSHILKVVPDGGLNLLHINPGAAGNQGWHQVRTIVRFAISNGRLQDLEVIELGARGKVQTLG